MVEALASRAEAMNLRQDAALESRKAAGKPTKRELGLLRWGKKGHKVSNKDPYGNADLEGAGSVAAGAMGGRIAAGGKKGRRGRKRDEFTRVTLPHHPSYEGPV